MFEYRDGGRSLSALWRPAFLVRAAPVFGLVLLALSPLVDRSWSLDRRAPEDDPPPVYFHIPSQPLSHALEAYARESGIEVLYESRIVESLQSTDVDGTFAPEAALRMLLGGTDLQVRYTRQNAITLSSPAEIDLPPASPLADADLSLDTLHVKGYVRADGKALQAFSEAIQFDIEKALRQNSMTRSGSYRIKVNLWVDASQKVHGVNVIAPTGDPERDASIPHVLEGLTLSRAPPANTPQPIQVTITVRSL